MNDSTMPSSPMDFSINDVNEAFHVIFSNPPVVVADNNNTENHHQNHQHREIEENAINIDQFLDLDRISSLSIATEQQQPVITFNDNNSLQVEDYDQNNLQPNYNADEFFPQNLQSNNPSEEHIIDWTNIGGFPNPSLMDTPSNNGELCVWPNPIPLNCNCCNVLREIIHFHGANVTKLEIHGMVGMISHAILENRYAIDTNGNTTSEYQMFDFSKKSIEDVREFLLQYCDERRRTGHELIQDPLLVYYETLSVGLFPDYLDVADFFPPLISGFEDGALLSSGAYVPNVANADVFGSSGGASTSGTKDVHDGGIVSSSSWANVNVNGENEKGKELMVVEGGFLSFQQQQQQQQYHPLDQQQQHNEESGGGKGKKTTLALQRERTGRLALGDLSGYFNLPMEVAAKKINVCPTVMKKICRREGLPRWPYRKINSLERKIRAKTIIQNLKVGYERERVQTEIDLLQKEIDDIIAGLLKKKESR